MELTHQLRLPVPLEEAWAAFNDPRRVAPALPGTVVEDVDGDAFSGTVKVKLGPLPLAFDGRGRYTERDEAAHRLVVQTRGTDRRGLGEVSATHVVALSAAGTQTLVEVRTDLEVTGRPATLGRGVVADATDRVVQALGLRVGARVAEGLPGLPEAHGSPGSPEPGSAGSATEVVDHPVGLGAPLGAVDEPDPAAPAAARPAPSPSPGPAPRPPRPEVYTYRPYTNTAEPHVHAVSGVSRLLLTRVAPFAGLGALAGYTLLALRRRRRSGR